MKKQERKELRNRLYAARFIEKKIVATGKCPQCGSKLVRNTSIAGWWQCEQFGNEQFRARPSEPPCNFQCFTV